LPRAVHARTCLIPAAPDGRSPLCLELSITNDTTDRSAVLDSAHVGDIRGAFGTIRQGDVAPRTRTSMRLKTLLAVIGPGLIVMVGDNDAGAFGTYTQAGQNYGTRMLWTLLLLVPVLYVNQEMVLRLGAVTGVGHARLILERYGRFWGAFSVIDLFVLNALTIVTEFIGISLGLSYLGLPKIPGVIAAALLVIASVSTGSFRRFERICLILIAGSFTLIPVFLAAHPPGAQIAHDFLVPGMPAGAQLSTVMLLIIAIVGTTVAPWQLFFQQSYLIDKRITPRFIRYERVDLWIGIVIVIMGAAAMMAFSSTAFAGTPGQGHYTDALGVADGLATAAGHWAGVLFAIAMIDASIIGAAAVGLSTSYALGDVLGLHHSLHRRPSEAKAFYAIFAGLLLVSAVIVIIPGSPLGLLIEGVQTLAGVLLPSATVFLLLLCNDRGVLGPWVNSRRLNLFSGVVIAILVMLSTVLTASMLFPQISSAQIIAIFAGGTGLTMLAGAYLGWTGRLNKNKDKDKEADRAHEPALDRATWRMPPLALLTRPTLSAGRRIGLSVLRGYLLLASALVVVKVVQLALGH
jgi:NRAMP (natural resistance-associated macrophage protein)-like metal ion transporter